MICRISKLNDSKLSVARWTSSITLTSRYKVLSFADVEVLHVLFVAGHPSSFQPRSSGLNLNGTLGVEFYKRIEGPKPHMYKKRYCDSYQHIVINNNYSPKWRWVVLDIYRTAKH